MLSQQTQKHTNTNTTNNSECEYNGGYVSITHVALDDAPEEEGEEGEEGEEDGASGLPPYR